MKDLRIVESGLVPIYEDKEARRVVNARELHVFVESKQDFSDWIKARLEKYGFISDEDYSIILGNRDGDGIGKPKTEYLLTIDTAKEIAMVENNAKGRQVRKYFIECERRAKESSAAQKYDGIVNDPYKANDFILKLSENWKKDRDRMIELEAKVEADSTKVLFADSVAASDDTILIRQFAKQLAQNGLETGEYPFSTRSSRIRRLENTIVFINELNKFAQKAVSASSPKAAKS